MHHPRSGIALRFESPLVGTKRPALGARDPGPLWTYGLLRANPSSFTYAPDLSSHAPHVAGPPDAPPAKWYRLAVRESADRNKRPALGARDPGPLWTYGLLRANPSSFTYAPDLSSHAPHVAGPPDAPPAKWYHLAVRDSADRNKRPASELINPQPPSEDLWAIAG